MDMYVVVATAFGEKNQTISTPKPKEDAEFLADKIKETMDEIDKDFRAFSDIKVKKYEPESLNLDKDKKNSYNYSILDDLDKLIK